ncbi:hypothetical protein DSO57_1015349 [Entomophthora muscae]|uniref:Uncharacterized protein n=1 Tax=Entomophthora muscae TaxID=34485 RepID=A0ACC2UQK3_9FUNG|nr:hypothetical protein DSO57_1015349 [Entomophthora muscae]
MQLVSLFLLTAVYYCQDVPGADTRLFGKNDILNPKTAIKKFISTITPSVVPLGLKTLVFVPAVAKDPPGRIPAASADDVKKYFTNANIPTCPEEKIGGRDCICKETYSNVQYIEDKASRTLVVVAINRKYNQIVVAYRITDNIQNWIDNLVIQFTDVADMPEGVRVFRGVYTDFMSSYYRVKDAVEALLDDARFKNHTLFVTGYSLGGGLAQISTPSWHNLLKARNDRRRMEVVSYLNPRVGNRAFAEYLESFNIPITHFSQENDLVSHLPGRKQGYVHAGVEMYGAKINGKFIIRQCSQAYDEDPTCVLSTFYKKSALAHAIPLGKFVPLPPYC